MSVSNPPSYRSDEPTCYNCGGKGHWAIACPEPTRAVPAGLEAHRNAAQNKYPMSTGQYSYTSHHQNQDPNHRDQRGVPRRQKGPIITKYGNPPGQAPEQAPVAGQEYRQTPFQSSYPQNNSGYPPSHPYPTHPPAPYAAPPLPSYNNYQHPQHPPPPPPPPAASTYYRTHDPYPIHQYPPPHPQHTAPPPPPHSSYDSRYQPPPPPPSGHHNAPVYQQSPPRGPPPTPPQYYQSPSDHHHAGPYGQYHDRPYEPRDYPPPQARPQSRDRAYASPHGYDRSPSRGYDRYERSVSRHSDQRRQSGGHSRPPYPGPPRSSSPRRRYDHHQRRQWSPISTKPQPNKPHLHQEQKAQNHQRQPKPRSSSDHLPTPGPLLHALPQKPPNITKPAAGSTQEGQPGSRSQKKKERRKQAKSRAKERKKLANAGAPQNGDISSKGKKDIETNDVSEDIQDQGAETKSPDSGDEDDHMSDDESQEQNETTEEASADVALVASPQKEPENTPAAEGQADTGNDVITSTPVAVSDVGQAPVTTDALPSTVGHDSEIEPVQPQTRGSDTEKPPTEKLLEEAKPSPTVAGSRHVKGELHTNDKDGVAFLPVETLPAETTAKSSMQDPYEKKDQEKSLADQSPKNHDKLPPQPGRQYRRRSSDRRSRSPNRQRHRDRSRSRSRGRARSRSGSRGRSPSRASSASSLNSIEMDLLGMDPDEHKRKSPSREGSSRSPKIPRKKPKISAYSRRW